MSNETDQCDYCNVYLNGLGVIQGDYQQCNECEKELEEIKKGSFKMITETGHTIGETYISNYWGHLYTVCGEVVNEAYNTVDVIIMKEDGEIKTHHTQLSRKDVIV